MSYDEVGVLAAFAEKHGITYPLLSDQGSKVIRELGILNEQAAERVSGIPHPGTFIVGSDGTVRGKQFYPSYRERDTGSGVLAHVLGITGLGHGAGQQADGDGVRARAWLDQDTYAWGQRVWLTVELDVAPGFHVYGQPVPDGYQPLDVSVAPIDRVLVGAPVLPPSAPLRIDALNEDFAVHQGVVRIGMPLTFMVVDAGPLEVAIAVSYQVCSEAACMPPTSATFVLSIAESALVERLPKP